LAEGFAQRSDIQVDYLFSGRATGAYKWQNPSMQQVLGTLNMFDISWIKRVFVEALVLVITGPKYLLKLVKWVY
jgi:hypothetical protein